MAKSSCGWRPWRQLAGDNDKLHGLLYLLLLWCWVLVWWLLLRLLDQLALKN